MPQLLHQDDSRMDISVPRAIPSFSFADLLAPLSADEFARDIQGKKPVHVRGAADKFAFALHFTGSELN